VSPEATPDRLSELVRYYQEMRRAPDAPAQATPSSRTAAQDRPRGAASLTDGPRSGEVHRVASRHLSFGRDSNEPKPFRPVVALGRVRPPFYVGLAQTTGRGGGWLFFEIGPDDYEVNVGDERRWPKWLFRFPENVPLTEPPRYLGRLRSRTMNRVGLWMRHQGTGPPRSRSESPAQAAPGSDHS
jgi:hypothetical protein